MPQKVLNKHFLLIALKSRSGSIPCSSRLKEISPTPFNRPFGAVISVSRTPGTIWSDPARESELNVAAERVHKRQSMLVLEF